MALSTAKRSAKDAYQQEHNDLFDAIRNDKPFNEAELAAISTMTAILGRMCTYSGQQIEWEDAINSKIELVPKTFGWEPRLCRTPRFYPDASTAVCDAE